MMMGGPSKKPRQSGAGLSGLAARLTKRLAYENPRANLVFSPLSIYAAVALLAPGARGDTLDEILGLLGARSRDELAESISTMAADALKDRSDSGGPSVAFACGVWNERTRPLKPAYHEAVVGTYRAEARALDFRGNAEAAAEQINAWVADVTRNLIKDVVLPDDLIGKTDVVLANAIYFKGKWDQPFYERNTIERPFHRLDGATIDAPFMYNSSHHFVAVYDGFKVLKLQYTMPQQDYGGPSYDWTQYSMCIFLPDTYDGLSTFLDEITSRPNFVQEHLPWSEVKVRDFGVPKACRGPYQWQRPGADRTACCGHGQRIRIAADDQKPADALGRSSRADEEYQVHWPGNARRWACEAPRRGERGQQPPLFSPLSIYAVLALVAVGARAATLDEILRVLGAGSPLELEEFVSLTGADLLRDRSESGGPSVAFACGVWSDLTRPLKPAFREDVVDTYQAEASTVDFRRAPEEARGQINAWAAQATRNLIDSVLPPGSIKAATTGVVLGNAVYFKGTWEDQPFDRRHTVHIPFHRLDGSHVDVPYMQSWEKQFVAVHDGFKVLKLRYRMAARDHDRTTSVDFDPYTYNRVPYGGHDVPPYINLLHASAAEAIAAYRPQVQPMQMSDAPSIPPPPLALYSHVPPPPPFAPYFNVPPPPYAYPASAYPQFAFNRAGPYGYPMPNPYNPRPHVAAPVNHTNAFVRHSYAPGPQASMYAAPPQPADPTQFSMCIFLPDARDGLPALLDTIASRPSFLHDHLPEQRVNLREFRLPRFKLSFHGSVVAVLKKLGLELPFCDRADLSNMVEDDGSGLPILVDDIIHRAVIEVNEEGTKAAAVTMPQGLHVRREPPPQQLDFVADHPFAFYIVEEATGAVVFAGHVLDPSKEE
ncbi:unnamed protein product [Alopecurus aequalis]